MSYHEIEDSLESIAHIIHASSLWENIKKVRLQEIFSFQALFDTSDTFGRVWDIMKTYALTWENLFITKISVLPLFADILELSILEDIKLTREIYSIFLHAFLNWEIGKENGIPQEALELAKNKNFLRIRKIIESLIVKLQSAIPRQ